MVYGIGSLNGDLHLSAPRKLYFQQIYTLLQQERFNLPPFALHSVATGKIHPFLTRITRCCNRKDSPFLHSYYTRLQQERFTLPNRITRGCNRKDHPFPNRITRGCNRKDSPFPTSHAVATGKIHPHRLVLHAVATGNIRSSPTRITRGCNRKDSLFLHSYLESLTIALNYFSITGKRGIYQMIRSSRSKIFVATMDLQINTQKCAAL